jgi:hypothetical protein
MNYIGIDIHKKYSVACVQDERGDIVRRERIEGNRVEGFRRCLQGEPARAVMEAGWNWSKFWRDDVAETDVDLHRRMCIAECCPKSGADSFIIGVFRDPLGCHRFGIEERPSASVEAGQIVAITLRTDARSLLTRPGRSMSRAGRVTGIFHTSSIKAPLRINRFR